MTAVYEHTKQVALVQTHDCTQQHVQLLLAKGPARGWFAGAVLLSGLHVWHVICVYVCVQAVLVEHEKFVKKTKLLTDLVESKAQACVAAEAGQQQALEEARNSAFAQNQAVGQWKVHSVLHVCSSNTLLCFPEHSLQHGYSGFQDIVCCACTLCWRAQEPSRMLLLS